MAFSRSTVVTLSSPKTALSSDTWVQALNDFVGHYEVSEKLSGALACHWRSRRSPCRRQARPPRVERHAFPAAIAGSTPLRPWSQEFSRSVVTIAHDRSASYPIPDDDSRGSLAPLRSAYSLTTISQDASPGSVAVRHQLGRTLPRDVMPMPGPPFLNRRTSRSARTSIHSWVRCTGTYNVEQLRPHASARFTWRAHKSIALRKLMFMSR